MFGFESLWEVAVKGNGRRREGGSGNTRTVVHQIWHPECNAHGDDTKQDHRIHQQTQWIEPRSFLVEFPSGQDFGVDPDDLLLVSLRHRLFRAATSCQLRGTAARSSTLRGFPAQYRALVGPCRAWIRLPHALDHCVAAVKGSAGDDVDTVGGEDMVQG